ncbi:hypothetical protein LY76DRAFT_596602 [Colletotrichum caudatum]|nr:hypothetical protein LY76DRAFT_596602 [Colletotrichum caudatum]
MKDSRAETCSLHERRSGVCLQIYVSHSLRRTAVRRTDVCRPLPAVAMAIHARSACLPEGMVVVVVVVGDGMDLKGTVSVGACPAGLISFAAEPSGFNDKTNMRPFLPGLELLYAAPPSPPSPRLPAELCAFLAAAWCYTAPLPPYRARTGVWASHRDGLEDVPRWGDNSMTCPTIIMIHGRVSRSSPAYVSTS